MTPRAAARRFVDVVLRFGFTDILDLIELPDEQPEAQRATRAAYERLEAAIRQHGGYTEPPPDTLYDAVENAADSASRARVVKALDRFSTAAVEELTVKQQAAYLIGCEVGAVLHRPVPLKLDVRRRRKSLRARPLKRTAQHK